MHYIAVDLIFSAPKQREQEKVTSCLLSDLDPHSKYKLLTVNCDFEYTQGRGDIPKVSTLITISFRYEAQKTPSAWCFIRRGRDRWDGFKDIA